MHPVMTLNLKDCVKTFHGSIVLDRKVEIHQDSVNTMVAIHLAAAPSQSQCMHATFSVGAYGMT